ncbi:hypothetical protein MAPG_10564 [Magnaporthiopsis poae ATCC 64411]|uniref:Uncharacterized protein n=1 Tax=Magnaporthiopsis poae (strain ATCC 64411 / 73-15) TaxID=644358 RepID=A0A0C4ECX5_MAGP6|nr:hypothetical protein MAPG_10564 [Magnaporthiopsis poae ATCC 64411]
MQSRPVTLRGRGCQGHDGGISRAYSRDSPSSVGISHHIGRGLSRRAMTLGKTLYSMLSGSAWPVLQKIVTSSPVQVNNRLTRAFGDLKVSNIQRLRQLIHHLNHISTSGAGFPPAQTDNLPRHGVDRSADQQWWWPACKFELQTEDPVGSVSTPRRSQSRPWNASTSRFASAVPRGQVDALYAKLEEPAEQRQNELARSCSRMLRGDGTPGCLLHSQCRSAATRRRFVSASVPSTYRIARVSSTPYACDKCGLPPALCRIRRRRRLVHDSYVRQRHAARLSQRPAATAAKRARAGEAEQPMPGAKTQAGFPQPAGRRRVAARHTLEILPSQLPSPPQPRLARQADTLYHSPCPRPALFLFLLFYLSSNSPVLSRLENKRDRIHPSLFFRRGTSNGDKAEPAESKHSDRDEIPGPRHRLDPGGISQPRLQGPDATLIKSTRIILQDPSQGQAAPKPGASRHVVQKGLESVHVGSAELPVFAPDGERRGPPHTRSNAPGQAAAPSFSTPHVIYNASSECVSVKNDSDLDIRVAPPPASDSALPTPTALPRAFYDTEPPATGLKRDAPGASGSPDVGDEPLCKERAESAVAAQGKDVLPRAAVTATLGGSITLRNSFLGLERGSIARLAGPNEGDLCTLIRSKDIAEPVHAMIFRAIHSPRQKTELGGKPVDVKAHEGEGQQQGAFMAVTPVFLSMYMERIAG